MHIKEFDYDLEDGLAWITVEGKHKGSDDVIVQCCLKIERPHDPETGEPCRYAKAIDVEDCGVDWGLCGDANEQAFDLWGYSRCTESLFAKAKENGFTLLNDN